MSRLGNRGRFVGYLLAGAFAIAPANAAVTISTAPSKNMSCANDDLYWDTTTSGITNPDQGAGNVDDDPGLSALTTQQLQAGLPAGFDPAIWAENPKINNGLPYLMANPPQ
jgi:hypothetical protein